MNSDINHTEEMERAYHEAYTAMKAISDVAQEMSFKEFCQWVDSLYVAYDDPVLTVTHGSFDHFESEATND